MLPEKWRYFIYGIMLWTVVLTAINIVEHNWERLYPNAVNAGVKPKDVTKDVRMTIVFDASGYYENYTNMSVKDIQLEFEIEIANYQLNDLLNRLVQKERVMNK
jgi:hypothetical protein